MVMHALSNAWGGEIFIPKIPSYKILDVAKAIDSNCELRVVGVRPGEKIHEEMITSSDSYNTYDLGKYFVILPSRNEWDLDDFITQNNAIKVKENFSYSSGSNLEWETVESLKLLIKKYIIESE